MKYFNNETIYNAFIAGAHNVIEYKELLNRINVFPVPDSDTGNNLAATMESIIRDSELSTSIKETLDSISEAALLGARGNSGIIFAKFIFGFSNEIESDYKITIKEFSNYINQAVVHAYESISEPVEGTMITVIKKWASSIKKLINEIDNFPELLKKSLIEAEIALENTTEQLDVLKKAGVVDAGGQGFIKFIEGILYFVTGDRQTFEKTDVEKLNLTRDEKIDLKYESKYRYCTEALLENVDLNEGEIKKLMDGKGDSLIAVQTKRQTKVHIHTDNPSDIFDTLRHYGDITKNKIDDMYFQYLTENERKSNIALVTDSIADIPQDIIDRYQIHVINLNLIINGVNYLDKLSITSKKFYDRLANLHKEDNYPSSSQPTIKQIEDRFEFLKKHYDSIIGITVSKKLSGTWNVFTQVAKEYKSEFENIDIINSKLNSNAQGLLILEAAELIEQNISYEKIIKKVSSLRDQIKIYVSVDELKYMIRGGRVSPMKGFLANLLNLKPIISLDESGEGIAFSKSFSRKGVQRKIEKEVKEIKSKHGIKRYSIVHADALEKAKNYERMFSKIIGKKAEYITEISPIIGLNSGIGSVAISIIYN